jgi:hypothetical protein
MGYPFVKPKPAPRVAIPPVHLTARPPTGLVLGRGLGIQIPWNKSQTAIMLEVSRQYREAFPESNIPGNRDIIEWLYNRVIDAENTVKLLEREVSIAEDKIKDLHADVAILEAGKRGI